MPLANATTAPAAPQPDVRADRGTPRRVYRSVLTWLAGLSWTAITAVVGFLTTPLLLRWLGTAQFGAWEVVAEWIGYLGLTQIALGPAAITVFLLRAHTLESAEVFAATAKWALRVYVVAALLAIPAALALAWWAPGWLHAGVALTPHLRWAVAISALGLLLLSPFYVFRAVLETKQSGYRVRMALLLQSLLITALSLWWAWAGWGVAGMAAASVLGAAGGALLWWIWSRRWLAGWERLKPASVSRRELWRLNWPIFVSLAGNQINLLTDNTLVGIVSGLPSVTLFFLTQRAVQLAGAQATDIGTVSWAALGELRAQDSGAFQARVVELAGTVLGVSLIVTGTVAAFNQAFIQLWVGADRYAGDGLTLLTAASSVVFSYLVFFSWMLDTHGDTRLRLKISTAGSVLNLALSIVFLRWLGLAGVALGTLVAYLCTDAWNMPRLVARHYGVPAGALAIASLHALLRAGGWAVAIWWIAHALPMAQTWLHLCVELSLAGLAGALYGWALVLRPRDRAAWKDRWNARPRRA